jgi:hypothetical protein
MSENSFSNLVANSSASAEVDAVICDFVSLLVWALAGKASWFMTSKAFHFAEILPLLSL